MAKKQETATATTEADALDTITNAVADRLRGEIQDAHAEVESILMAIAAENRKPSFDESIRLRQLRPQWSDRDLNSEIRRASHVCKAQAVAGTAEDRAALAAAAEKAAADLADRGAVLRAEIAEREAAVRELEQTSDRLHRRQAETQAALERLGELLPEHIRKDLQARRKAASRDFGTEHNRLAGEIRHRARLATGPTPGKEHDWAADMQRAGARVSFGPANGGGSRPLVDPGAATDLFAAWEAEHPAMEQRLAELAAKLAEVEADERTAAEFYWR